MARLEPIHLKSSSAGIEVIRGTVYAEGYKVWNYDTDAWDEISVTSSGGGGVDIGSGSADELYVESLTANSIWGNCIDNNTIGINGEGQLYVKGVTPGMITYPFDLTSISYSDSTQYKNIFDEVNSTSFNFFNFYRMAWTYESNYQSSDTASGVQSVGFSLNMIQQNSINYYTDRQFLFDLNSGNNIDEQNIYFDDNSNDVNVYYKANSGDFIVAFGNAGLYEKYFTMTTLSAFDINDSMITNEINRTFYFIPPIFVFVADDLVPDSKEGLTAAINDFGNAKLPALKSTRINDTADYTFPYTLDDQYLNQPKYIYFAVPSGWDTSSIKIGINTQFGWGEVDTIVDYPDGYIIAGSEGNSFEYKTLRTTTKVTPVDDYNLQIRLNW